MPGDSPIDDAVDRILAAELNATTDGTETDTDAEAGSVVIVDDVTGALSLDLLKRIGPRRTIRRCHDSLVADRTVTDVLAARGEAIPSAPLGPDTFRHADLVIARLPRSLAALDELAYAVASQARPEVRLLGGGRDKHLSRGMNDVLARHFVQVSASRGRQKSRVLRASGARPGPPPHSPNTLVLPDLELTVCAFGGVFAGPALDLGTRLLLDQRSGWPPAGDIVDLGCGTGLLAVTAARLQPQARIRAIDESWAAVRSARATAQANGLAGRIAVEQTDGLAGVADGSADLILCNPPFHRGAARDSSTAFAMIDSAARALRPGGELWLVYNAHLPYLSAVRRVGPTAIVARDQHFLVTRTRRPAATA